MTHISPPQNNASTIYKGSFDEEPPNYGSSTALQASYADSVTSDGSNSTENLESIFYTRKSVDLESQPKSIVSNWRVGWKTPLLMFGSYATAFVFASTHLGLFLYLNGKAANGPHAIPQTYVSTTSQLLARLFSLCLSLSLAFAYVQHLWHTLRTTSVKVSDLDLLLQIRNNVFFLGHTGAFRTAPLLILLAITYWLIPIAVIYPPGALIVTPVSVNNVYSLSVPTFDASSTESSAAGFVDQAIAYVGATSWPKLDSRNSTYIYYLQSLISGTVLSNDSPCGPDCKYSLDFVGPYLKCDTKVYNESTALSMNPDPTDYTAFSASLINTGLFQLNPVLLPNQPPQSFAFNISKLIGKEINNTIGARINENITWQTWFQREATQCTPMAVSYRVQVEYVNGRQGLTYTHDMHDLTLLNANSQVVDTNCPPVDTQTDLSHTKCEILGESSLMAYRNINLFSLVHAFTTELSGPIENTYKWVNTPNNRTAMVDFKAPNGTVLSLYQIQPDTLVMEPPKLDVQLPDLDVSPQTLNEALANFTFNMMFQRNQWKTNVLANVTTTINIYSFGKGMNLLLPYFLALAVAVPFLILGTISLYKNEVSAVDGGFLQTIMTTTKSQKLHDAAAGGCLGGLENVPQELLNLKVKFGELTSVRSDNGVRRAGLSTEDEIIPLDRNAIYGYEVTWNNPFSRPKHPNLEVKSFRRSRTSVINIPYVLAQKAFYRFPIAMPQLKDIRVAAARFREATKKLANGLRLQKRQPSKVKKPEDGPQPVSDVGQHNEFPESYSYDSLFDSDSHLDDSNDLVESAEDLPSTRAHPAADSKIRETALSPNSQLTLKPAANHKNRWSTKQQKRWGSILSIQDKDVVNLLEQVFSGAKFAVARQTMGQYNRVFLATGLYNEHASPIEVAVRINVRANLDKWDPKLDAFKLEQQSRACNWIHQTFGLAPKTYCYCTSFNNPLGHPHMIMEWMKGTVMFNSWNSWIPGQEKFASLDLKRSHMLKSLARAVSRLETTKFNAGGSLYFLTDDPHTKPLVGPYFVEAEHAVGLDAHFEPAYASFGEVLADKWAQVDHAHFGGYKDQKKGALWLLQKVLKTVCSDHDDEALKTRSLQELPEPSVILTAYKALGLLFPADGDLDGRSFYIKHPDLNYQNILVDEYSTVIGFIDWDIPSTVSASFAYAMFPLFLCMDWNVLYKDRVGDTYYLNNSIPYLDKYREWYAQYIEECVQVPGSIQFVRISHILSGIYEHLTAKNVTGLLWIAEKIIREAKIIENTPGLTELMASSNATAQQLVVESLKMIGKGNAIVQEGIWRQVHPWLMELMEPKNYEPEY
ncbi:hypothetical protein BT63DRAFT_456342 [Microthyrium microscopicum]|uniref:Aminoglycoside phosphotransferase domain-containing protein n=1 Tax=Microthyrium microscopicum TaxID=703497 RepID=A0A6A6U943_9PEZI|nr:hypothetical protein BT63DRAFT_456342 [Microthyrium microscopicum]